MGTSRITRERKTNEEVVQELMTHNVAGALVQPFILQALRVYSQQVIKAGPEACDTPLVSGRAWVACAQDLLNRLEEWYGQ